MENERATFLPMPWLNREKCVPECMGCNKMYSEVVDCVLEDNVCISYLNPKAIHRLGCFLKSNKEEDSKEVKKINPLKASKRGNR